VIVAVGGGACLDVGKGVALGATNDVPVRALDYRTPGLAPGLAGPGRPDDGGHGL
jgi:alcohol dehydrogenase class IV